MYKDKRVASIGAATADDGRGDLSRTIKMIRRSQRPGANVVTWLLGNPGMENSTKVLEEAFRRSFVMGIKVARFDMLGSQVNLGVHDGKNGQPVEGEAK
jgi:hypothetical protein